MRAPSSEATASRAGTSITTRMTRRNSGRCRIESRSTGDIRLRRRHGKRRGSTGILDFSPRSTARSLPVSPFASAAISEDGARAPSSPTKHSRFKAATSGVASARQVSCTAATNTSRNTPRARPSPSLRRDPRMLKCGASHLTPRSLLSAVSDAFSPWNTHAEIRNIAPILVAGQRKFRLSIWQPCE
jgi:hypothetical protein